MSEIMKIRDQGETQTKQNKTKQKKRQKRTSRTKAERVRVTWIFCAFKLGFLQLICEASLIFSSNLELALSIILKER